MINEPIARKEFPLVKIHPQHLIEGKERGKKGFDYKGVRVCKEKSLVIGI